MKGWLYSVLRFLSFPFDLIQERILAFRIEEAFKHGFDIDDLLSSSFFSEWLEATNVRHSQITSEDTLHSHINSMQISNKEYRTSFSDIITNRKCLVYRKGNTGGSTGEPLSFEYGLTTGFVERAHQQFLYSLYGIKRKDSRIMSFSGCRPDSKDLERNVYWKRRALQFPYGRYDMSSLFISAETIHDYANKYKSYKPNIVRGYPSAIASFIELCNLGQIDLPEPKFVLLTSEQISDGHIQTIRLLWRCPIIKQYGMSEASVFAFSFHNYNGYYCSPFYGYTEVLNPEGRHVEEGETGQVVVTGYGNTRQPFLRYETGDLAVYDGIYNGFVKLLDLKGRTADYIISANQEKIMLVGLVFGYHSDIFSRINQWQIVQDMPGSIRLNLRVDANWDSVYDESKVCDVFVDFEVEFTYDDDFVFTKSGKRPFLIQNI